VSVKKFVPAVEVNYMGNVWLERRIPHGMNGTLT
jgi:hypothetical protein